MSTLLARIIQEAKRTFDKSNRSLSFKNKFFMLKNLVDELTLSDLNISPAVITNNLNEPDKAPCTYIHIFENDLLSLSVFIINEPNYTMPLHDHPYMSGLVRVLSGRLRINSYTGMKTILNDAGEEVMKHVFPEPIKNIGIHNESSIVSESIGNYHEITAVEGPAAFFDLLSPKYETIIPVYGPIKCNFYSKVHNPDDGLVHLKKIPTPTSYFCDSLPYELPDNCKKE